MVAAVVLDGAAAVVAALGGYLLGRFHQARRGGHPRHVRVSLDVDDDPSSRDV